jgi:hypothetical protein
VTKRKALTEEEWLSSESTHVLLCELTQHRGAARTAAGRRLLRLFGCTCCRQCWHLFTDADSRRAVEVAERYADGRASRADLQAARRSAEAAEQRAMDQVLQVTGGSTLWAGQLPPDVVNAHQARGTAAAAVATVVAGDLARAAESAALHCCLAAVAGQERWDDPRPVRFAVEAMQCALLRDLFNPFQSPSPFDPTVLAHDGGAARRLAESIYQERRFEDLPVLADLLEEAGLTDAALLDHLRGPGPHGLGCHALDAVLGKQ